MERSKQFQILLTERLYPDVKAIIQELKAWTGLTTKAQVTAHALRAFHTKERKANQRRQVRNGK